jgi:hypothetical protein
MNLPSLTYLERYRNEGTRTYSPHAAYTEADGKYRPNSPHRRFEMAIFEMPRHRMTVYIANPHRDLASTYLGASHVQFCIHPQVIEGLPDDPYVRQTLSLCTAHRTIPVVPSSSTRAVFAAETNRPHAIKVHFPFRISRYSRKMRDEVVEQAVNVSRELENGIHRLDDRFAFLREVIGVVHDNQRPKDPRGENWGYLVRDMTPFPHVGEARRLIPGFALYGKDYFDPGKPLLLFDLIGDSDPVVFILDNIMLPIIRHWAACFLNFGYLIEPHGQNVLFEVDRSGAISRIVHRDLSVGIDMRRRRDIGLSDKGLNHYNRMEHHAFHSITYDRFMGGHFFDRLVSACRVKYSKLAKADFTEPCREEFSRIMPEHTKYFPETVWYFSEKRDRFNKPLYRDTGAAPEWRP